MGMQLNGHSNNYWVMLTSAFRVLVNNPFKESFYGKGKKKSN